MDNLQVGKVLPNFIKSSEGVSFRVSENSLDLIITLTGVMDSEIKGVRTGELNFGLGEIEDIPMFFASVGGALELSDMPICIYEGYNLPVLENKKEGYAVTIMLIEAMTGELKALRLVGLGHEFSNRLKELCDKSGPKSISEISFKVFGIQSRYTSQELSDEISEITYRIPKK